MTQLDLWPDQPVMAVTCCPLTFLADEWEHVVDRCTFGDALVIDFEVLQP